jgi:NTP pyrophosphatase (non-canonical NTP hydrolase)
MGLNNLNEKVRDFCEDRDWTQYHTPKDLAIGLSTESNELLELFRFKNEASQREMLAHSESRTDVEDEIADILFFVLRFADLYDIDIEEALESKIIKNREKYPKQKHKSNDEADGETEP